MKRMITAALLMASGFCLLFGAKDVQADAKVPENVHIADIDVGGMTEDEVMKELEDYQETVRDQGLILDIEGNKYGATMGDLGFEFTNLEELAERAVSLQSMGNLIQLYKTQEDLARNKVDLELQAVYSQEAVRQFIESSAAPHNVQAVSATVTRGGANGFTVNPSTMGKQADTENAYNEAVQRMDSWDRGGTIEVAVAVSEVRPTTVTEDLNGFGAVLGQFTTQFNDADKDRNYNLTVGTAKLNGTFIEAGATFDLYSVLGPFTTGNGYRRGHAYANGEIIDSIGGGVCQICTTLYVASLYAELGIVTRFNHSMTVGYVPLAWDATIASGGYKTLRLRNDTGYPIYIASSSNGGNVTVQIFGRETRPANRKVEFQSRVLSGPSYLAPQETPDPGLPAGQRVVTEEGHPAASAQLIKNVYINGALQSSTVLNTSSYKPYAERVNVGTGGSTPEPEPTPEETTAEPTPEETTTKAPEPTTAEPTTKAPETTAPTTTAAAKN